MAMGAQTAPKTLRQETRVAALFVLFIMLPAEVVHQQVQRSVNPLVIHAPIGLVR